MRPLPLAALGSSDYPTVGVTGVTLDSRAVLPGDLYAALPGANTHGARFATQARDLGAAAVLTDAAGAQWIPGDMPVLVVEDPRAALGQISAQIYDDPAAKVNMLGFTGTNGKTTMTYLARAGLQHLGHRVGIIGTTGTFVDDRRIPTARTTPESPDVQALLALMVASGVDTVAMEVSSHALVLGRVDGIVFDVAVFANLSPDHLDFHVDMADYFAAKASLFTHQRARFAVINADDAWGEQLYDDIAIAAQTYALDAGHADWRATDIEATATGSRFTVNHGGHAHAAQLAMPGVFNVSNALATVAALHRLGVDVAQAVAAVGTATGVPGRMEVVPDQRGEVAVLVDYAHTPDAVHRALSAVAEVTGGRIWSVLGCGGDRDRMKRPDMGRIAATVSDHVIVTDDNPRSEDPAQIRAAVLDGAHSAHHASVQEIGDRKTAIRTAITSAEPGDCVMILGKGHEVGQEVQGRILEHDDRIVAAEVLAELAGPS